MTNMFEGASSFNQDLSNWCVSEIVTQPLNFDADATAWTEARPDWGSCVNNFFTTVWNTTLTRPGGSTNAQVVIPMRGNGYDFTIYWGDGSSQTHTADPGANVSHSLTKTYSESGVYVVRISGDFPQIYFNNYADRDKLLAVQDWGTIQWASFERAFYGAINMNGTYTIPPNLSNVTDMAEMFKGCRSFNHAMDDWDVSTVQNMNSIFNGARAFNKPIGNWDVSSVTSMNEMFGNAISFNQDIGNWVVSAVINMEAMFEYAQSFNQDLSNWCVTQIPSAPEFFDSGASSWVLPRPIWGTCP
jgi:surface protein